MTGYSAVLLSVFCSPATGSTVTFSVVGREGDVRELAERGNLRRPWVDERDRDGLGDRFRLEDGQRDLDLGLLEVARVANEYLERELVRRAMTVFS